MKKMIYKMYDPDNNKVIFESLTELADCMDLTDMEIARVFRAKHVATLNNGEQVIIYRS